MSRLSTVSTGAQLGNRFATKAAVQSNKDVIDQMNLNATIDRVNRVRSQYGAVVEEGKRLSETISSQGETLALSGSERADEIRNTLAEGINNVQNNSSRDVAGKTAMLQARSKADMFESGKGVNVNVES